MDKKNKSWGNFKRLFKNLWFFGRLSFQNTPIASTLIIIMAVLEGIFPVATSKVFGYLIDSITGFIKSGRVEGVWEILAVYIMVKSALPILDTFFTYNFKYWWLKFSNFIDLYILEKRSGLDIAHMEDPAFQDFAQRAFNNGNSPILNIMDIAQQNLRRLILFLGSSIAIFLIDWRIFAITLVSSIPNFIVEVYYGGTSWGIFAENSREQRRYYDNRFFFTSKYRFIEAKLFQIHNFLIEHSKDILDRFFGKQIDLEKRRLWFKFFTELLSAVGVYVSLFMAVNSALAGIITLGTVAFLFTAINSLNGAFSDLLLQLARQLERNLYVNDIVDFISTKSIVKHNPKPVRLMVEKTPIIEFKNVSFKYPKQESTVLKNISFVIRPGEKVAFVGHNGAGKTTIVRLLLRIHDVTEGEVLVNGLNIKDIDLNQWWSRLGVLTQDYSGFQYPAKEAIAVGDRARDLDLEKVIKAAKQSTASNFIESWPEKYETMIGVEFGGEELSKGERQKMALARVFYRDADIFVLDEPTAAVDAPSASEIFRNIESLPESKSALIISHNFATIRRANKIIVLEQGQIIESGVHEELVKADGLYNRLYNQQKSEYN